MTTQYLYKLYFFSNCRSDGEETEGETGESDRDIDIKSIDHLDLSQIHSAKLMDENQRRLIWLAKVQYDQTRSFSIVIKDCLPNHDIDLYKQYRLNEFNSLPQHRRKDPSEEIQYEFSSRSRVDYKHESKLLLNELKNHPFIVHAFICDHQPENDLRIFMEYLPHGNLHTYLRQLESDSQDSLINAFHWIYQLAQVMAYLSNKKIVHRDLAVRNILLKNEKYIKLSDFGLSRLEGIELEGKDCFVPSRWVAPECFDRHATISSSSDVWSFGIVIWEIYSFGATPYEAETGNSSQPLARLLKRFLVQQNRRLSRPDYCPESLYDLMCRCWNGNISRRLRFVDMINEFNGTSIVKDCIVPFTREERKAWREAKDEYFSINQSSRNLSNNDPEYVEVE
jgi:serine/threonine protein kinase